MDKEVGKTIAYMEDSIPDLISSHDEIMRELDIEYHTEFMKKILVPYVRNLYRLECDSLIFDTIREKEKPVTARYVSIPTPLYEDFSTVSINNIASRIHDTALNLTQGKVKIGSCIIKFDLEEKRELTEPIHNLCLGLQEVEAEVPMPNRAEISLGVHSTTLEVDGIEDTKYKVTFYYKESGDRNYHLRLKHLKSILEENLKLECTTTDSISMRCSGAIAPDDAMKLGTLLSNLRDVDLLSSDLVEKAVRRAWEYAVELYEQYKATGTPPYRLSPIATSRTGWEWELR